MSDPYAKERAALYAIMREASYLRRGSMVRNVIESAASTAIHALGAAPEGEQ